MEAIIFCGLQAAGKSTFYEERFFNTHIRINLDMLRTRHREKLLLQACLEMKQPFVVDNTNPTITERANYIQPAKASGFRLVCYYFAPELKSSLERNATRNDKERVPERGLFGTYHRLQPPTFTEGFDAIFSVCIGENNTFVVSELSQRPLE